LPAAPTYDAPPAEQDAATRKRALASDDARLLRRYQRDRDAETRAELLDRFLPLARHLARRYHGQAEREDLEQVAAFALLKAIDRFDIDRGMAFTSFAVPTIIGELKRYFRDYSWSVHVPRSIKDLKVRLDASTRELSAQLGRSPTPLELANCTGATVEQVMEALAAHTAHRADSLDRPLSEDGDSGIDLLGSEVDPGYAHAENATLVQSLLNTLPERERLILRLRFHEDLTQAEIGERLGISQMHVSRLIRKSITRLQALAG
jgi:RNA polymerase sigma-B factor